MLHANFPLDNFDSSPESAEQVLAATSCQARKGKCGIAGRKRKRQPQGQNDQSHVLVQPVEKSSHNFTDQVTMQELAICEAKHFLPMLAMFISTMVVDGDGGDRQGTNGECGRGPRLTA